MRAGANYLVQMNVADFARRHSWNATGRFFLSALENPPEAK
jgi:hypothetical protein